MLFCLSNAAITSVKSLNDEINLCEKCYFGLKIPSAMKQKTYLSDICVVHENEYVTPMRTSVWQDNTVHLN